MRGIICMWHGLIVDIPNGWALCDGSNGTPDLRDRFVIGAAQGDNPGDIGGAWNHHHTYFGYTGYYTGYHDHDYDGDTDGPSGDSSGYYDDGGYDAPYEYHFHSFDGTTSDAQVYHRHFLNFQVSTESHLPPYYTILFIMKK